MAKIKTEIRSLSSALMLGTTQYRNQKGFGNKLVAQFGYALIVNVALVEASVALFFSAISLVTYPCSSDPFDRDIIWFGSSAFTVGWALVDFVFNLFVGKLVVDEKSARRILLSGDLMTIPRGAIV